MNCIHQLNKLGHCTRCGGRPNDFPFPRENYRETMTDSTAKPEYEGPIQWRDVPTRALVDAVAKALSQLLETTQAAEAGKAQAEWEDLLNAARMVITAHTCKHPDLSREEAESRAMRALIVAVDAFPHPCAAAALPPPPSAPEGT